MYYPTQKCLIVLLKAFLKMPTLFFQVTLFFISYIRLLTVSCSSFTGFKMWFSYSGSPKINNF